MKIGRPFSFVLINSTPEKQFANLGQASAFFPSDVDQGSLDFTRDPEADAFVFRCHDFSADFRPSGHAQQIICPLDAGDQYGSQCST